MKANEGGTSIGACAVCMIAVVVLVSAVLAGSPPECNWADAECDIPLFNGTVLTVKCELTCDDCDKDADGLPCPDPQHRYRFCRRICNAQGQVVSGACVCGCLPLGSPSEPNCP